MEEELARAKKLESVGILAGGIAHDFNNLLSVIIGNISLVQDDIKTEGEVSDFLEEAEEASLRAQELTKQLITFSKGGAPVKRRGSIGDLVKESVCLSISDFHVECEFSIPPELWLAEFDEGQMTHAINNLITNAVESIPGGGSIEVKAENSIFSSEILEQNLPLPKGKYVKISIRDQGLGIPEEHLPMIFDPYFSTKERGTQKGMGPGLTTTFSIINKHDGHITVKSEVGVGTIFTLYLPAHEKDTKELGSIEIPKPEKAESHLGRILLMDDENMIRDLAKQMLSRCGYDVELAKDGVEAIELYKRAMNSGKSFDVVILDLTVKGGMGGKGAVKKILEIDPQVKAIVSSGYYDDPVMTDFRQYGFIEALSKPYAMKDLSDTFDKITVQKN